MPFTYFSSIIDAVADQTGAFGWRISGDYDDDAPARHLENVRVRLFQTVARSLEATDIAAARNLHTHSIDHRDLRTGKYYSCRQYCGPKIARRVARHTATFYV